MTNDGLHADRRRDPGGDAYGELGLTVEVEEHHDVSVAVARGVIDFWNVGPMQERLNDAFLASPHVVLDLRDVSFVDSTGLGLLLSVHDRAMAEGGWLRLAALNPLVRRLLQTTELERRFHVYPTLTAATASLG
ncbi:STAS domain-containing protein [Phytohabitans sp. ZYX-F-186]|uniref:Anti-sigma factor antagonist n=1 Tax=Phytohabitans maris TaxID=3071409 RepID=A0ABU0ZH03_9ACTN|nr:STAS domain-containing protein [Phytohabitans sp. ZYX-F-186]MDQ7906295.1 STAS domain-containing protein [Phytohabitans sp. ZYX-F-186]